MSTPAFANSTALQLDTPLSGVSPLPHLGVIRAFGADAGNFLHNQLTNDVLLMKEGECRLAAFCNAKGRMQASFVVYKRSPEEVLLICRRDLIAQTVKRLSMFVMRTKATLSDATAEFQLLGLAGESVGLVLGDALFTAQTLPAWQRRVWASPLAATTEAAAATADVLTLYPALDQPRALWIAPVGVPLPAHAGPVLTPALWQVGEVLSGIAWVEQATFEAFVPQMLNYESVDGVNFKKGCYPGQEIVARSQFRGTLKRRAFIVKSTVPMTAGQEVFSSLDATQPCGLIAQAAHDGAVCVAIAELQLSATENSSLHLGASEGAVLQLLPLPYALRDDI